ncbi:MAG: hypothetical protein ACOY37_12615 [Pseudomonadota bacterium]
MNVRKASLRGLPAAFLLSFLVLLAGCAARPAPGIGGRWTPVNRYPAQAQEIPLRPAYAFYATPMDRTLKGMLERWARDRHMTLAYQHASDFTLHAPVAELRTDDLDAAVARLNALYAAQRVAVAVEGERIVVRAAAPEAAP